MYAAARGTGRSSLQRRPREPVLQALISARICWRSQKEKLKTMLTLPSSKGMQSTYRLKMIVSNSSQKDSDCEISLITDRRMKNSTESSHLAAFSLYWKPPHRKTAL